MRKIEANIRKLKFKEVKLALTEAGHSTFTYWAVRSVSDGSKKLELTGGDPIAKERIALSIIVQDNNVDETIDLIVSAGQTKEVDDTRIYVYAIAKAYKIVGGENGDKFNLYNFRDLLIQCANMEVDKQKDLLQETFEQWKGSYDQLDDVLVLGIQFK